MVEEGDTVADELDQACLLQKSQFRERRRGLNCFRNHELFRVVEPLLKQWDENGGAVPANEGSDADDAVKEGAAQVLVFLVVEESYDV